MKYRKLVYYLLFISILTFLFVFSVDTTSSILTTVDLYINKVFPSLFLFVLFTSLVIKSSMLEYISKAFSFITKPFRLKKESSSAVLLGFLCGFPSASSAIDKLYENRNISKKEAYHLMFFTNNASPIFIFSAVGNVMLGSKSIGLKLLFIHFISSIILGIIYPIISKDKIIIQENTDILKINIKNSQKKLDKFDILKLAIIDTFKTMLFILAYMIIFNILADILNSYNVPYLKYITATFELTKGISSFSSIPNIPYISFLLGFSSLSIIFQIKSSLKTLDYPIKRLIMSKLLHGLFSYLIALVIF